MLSLQYKLKNPQIRFLESQSRPLYMDSTFNGVDFSHSLEPAQIRVEHL